MSKENLLVSGSYCRSIQSVDELMSSIQSAVIDEIYIDIHEFKHGEKAWVSHTSELIFQHEKCYTERIAM